MIVCTSICANYLPKAKVLAASLKRFNKNAQFVLGLVEDSVDSAADHGSFDMVVLAKELGIEDFQGFMFKHSIVEAATAVKGHLFLELLRRFPQEDEFVYLDPDIQVFGQLEELQAALKHHDIVLTPHLCEPEDDYDNIIINEICALKHGVFNLGFLAIRRSKQSLQFLDWWASRLEEFCYDDIPGGLFTDQRWMDLAPCFFDIHVLRHPGYNMAPWNLSKRVLNKEDDGRLTVNGQHLRFFHFSGFDSGANEEMVRKYCTDPANPVYELRENYIAAQEQAGQSYLGKLSWSYDCYSTGEKILKTHREYYRFSRELHDKYPNPFAADGNDTFYRHVMESPIENKATIARAKREIRQLWNYTKEDYRTGGVGLVAHKVYKKILRQFG